MKRIGVLALQGGFKEHLDKIRTLGHEGIEVRKPEDLEAIHGIILPGGESTAIGKLMTDLKLKEPLINKIKAGLPTWGTCAGLILLATTVDQQKNIHLNLMDISVKRNAYGSQLNSFLTEALVEGIAGHKIPMVFIRAPYITHVGAGVKILATVDNNIVAAQAENILVSSFHPELTEDLSFHKFFIKQII